MKIFLTGALGFVGFKLLRTLEAEGVELTVLSRRKIDNLSPKIKCITGDLKTLGNTPNDSIVFNTITKEKELVDFKVLNDIDVVVHCAARVHVMDDSSSNSLSEFLAVNTEGTLRLARHAADSGVKRFIFLSSIKVNGESTSDRSPYTAFDKRLPNGSYGISKSEAEDQLVMLGEETGMEIVIIRPPLVYGEGVKASFYSLMRLVSIGFPLPFRAINHNKRSLVSVYNLVDLIKVCIYHPKARNQVFLVSDDDDVSTSQMVALMAKVQGKLNLSIPLPIFFLRVIGKIFKKETVVDRLVGSLQLDIEHTKKTLDWAPPFSIEHGFKLAAKKSSEKKR